jgi:hypothetical protein
VSKRFRVPFKLVFPPLNYSGNPGVDGVSYMGANGNAWASTRPVSYSVCVVALAPVYPMTPRV